VLNVVTLSVLPESCQKQKSSFYFFISLIINGFLLTTIFIHCRSAQYFLSFTINNYLSG